MQWDRYFIKMAMLVASKSKDPSTKVGCVIVGPDNEVRSTGFNGFPRGVTETAEGSRHLPGKFERSLAGNEYMVTCSCGDVISIATSHLDSNVHGVYPTTESYRQIATHMAEVHDHFNPQERVLHPERWERPLKYDYVEHAERNAVYNAARIGTALKGCKAYLNWEPYPCKDCAKGFIQSGIVEVIGPDIEFPNHKKAVGFDVDQWQVGDQWKFTVSKTLMEEAGVKCREVQWKD